LLSTIQSTELLRQVLLGFSSKVTFMQALGATAGNMAIKAALPAGTGELVRVAYLSRACNVKAARATAAIATLLWLKLAWLFLLSIAGFSLLPSLLPSLLLVTCLLVVILIPVLIVRTGRTMKAEERRGLRNIVPALARATKSMKAPGLVVGALHALLSTSAEIFVFGLLLHAVNGTVDPVSLLAYLPLVIIGAKLPLTILGLGTRELLVVILLSGANAPATLTAAAILFSAVKYVLPALLGAALTWSYIRRLIEKSPRQ
jgi:uncharacterized membrane protein YbhN (UPF0104 family)